MGERLGVRESPRTGFLSGALGAYRTVLFWLFCCAVISLCGCASSSAVLVHGETGGGGGFGRNSAEARIVHLISEGQFAEAEALIVESSSSGLIEESAASALRKSIAEQSMKLGELPATLQRVASFPAKLREYTRFQIQRMLEQKDFTLATKKELQTALKLLKEQNRLMDKN